MVVVHRAFQQKSISVYKKLTCRYFQILDIYESPLFLQLNPGAKNSDIPLTMYESLYDIVKGEAKMLFVKLNYSLATEEVSL